MEMDLPAGADNQLLVSDHYNTMSSCSMQVETSHPSFGSMMALMTAEQLDLDKKSQQQPASHFMHDYYSDPYNSVTVFQGCGNSHSLSAHEQLSYEQLVIASCVQAQAVDMSCTQVQQLKNHCHGDDEDEGELQEEGERTIHVQRAGTAAGATMISRKCEGSETVCHGNAAVLRSQISSLDDIVERRDLAAGSEDIKSSAKEELVMTKSTASGRVDEQRLREKIVTHPDYRRLVVAYINCRKVGAPPDVVRRLEELSKEYDTSPELLSMISRSTAPDPELDHFMKTYCHVLHQYEEELSKPFNEAMAFLQKVELQISQLVMCRPGASTQPGNDGMSSTVVQDEQQQEEHAMVGEREAEDMNEEEMEEDGEGEEGGSCGEVLDYEQQCSMQDACCNMNGNYSMDLQQAEEKQLKEQLLRKYRGYISTLKNEFMKKKKKGKLPKDARQCLLDWWHEHYRWPYPSETEKVKLAETTGLDQKQINNWFINQRKRHWKPSDQDVRYVMVNGQDPPMHDNVNDSTHLT